MGDRLATIDMGRKLGTVPLFGGGELGPHLTQCGRAKFHLDPYKRLATIYQRRRQTDRQENGSIA